MDKVDVIVQVYGKPWQTLCTLKSLMLHNEDFIDQIYFIEEKEQPYGDKVDWVVKEFTNVIHIKLDTYQFWAMGNTARYQKAIENSNKTWVFITHNDVNYTGNVIKNMLDLSNEFVCGIGEIGQCWNCPAKELCGGGENWNNWNPAFEEINFLKLPHVRTNKSNLNKDYPKLMPECRLNEWACLINRKTSLEQPYFGEYDNVDIGIKWFQEMYKRGYKFVDYRKDFIHGYWANNAGYPTQLNKEKYKNAEENAKIYYEKNLK